MPSPEAAALERKYRTLVAWRDAHAHDGAVAARGELQRLAVEFPGCLRELDTLPREELERRADVLARGDDEPWVLPLARYHALMRTVLAVRRSGGDADRIAALADALAAETGIALDAADVDAIARPPQGRLVVYVFERLGALFGVEPDALRDQLFPEPATARRRRAAQNAP